MSSRNISQRSARMYKKQAEKLEREREQLKNRWALDYGPGWVHIGSITLGDEAYAKVSTARLLKHAVILVNDTGNSVRMYAERLP